MSRQTQQGKGCGTVIVALIFTFFGSFILEVVAFILLIIIVAALSR